MMSDLQNNRQAVPPSMGDTELYEQIAAGDEQAVHTARHNSLGMSVMVWYMRWTLLWMPNDGNIKMYFVFWGISGRSL